MPITWYYQLLKLLDSLKYILLINKIHPNRICELLVKPVDFNDIFPLVFSGARGVGQ